MKANALEHLALNDKGFAFDAATGHTYTLNETGTLVMKMIMNGKSEEEIIKNLTRDYLVPQNRAERDLADFFHCLADMNILKASGKEADHEE